MKYIAGLVAIIFIAFYSAKAQDSTLQSASIGDSLLYYKQKVQHLKKRINEVKQFKWKLRDYSKRGSYVPQSYKLLIPLSIICVALLVIVVIFFILFLHYRKIVQSFKDI